MNSDPPAGQGSILVVDDTPANIRLLAEMLSAHGYEVRVAVNGELALQSVREERPDLILLDIRMPHMDGFQVCRALQAEEETRHIPVIFLSALEDPTHKLQAFDAGGVDYVTKPFESVEVLARVATHLRLRRLQQQLATAKLHAEAANRAKSAFLANMSHELRTPLNAVMGYAQILECDETLSADQRHGVQIIQHSGDYLLTLINDVLDLAKIEADHLELCPEPFKLEIFFHQISEVFSVRARQKKIDFKYEALTPLSMQVEADEKRLRQILMNLLGNAVKFTEQGGVSLSAAYQNGVLQVAVTDSGPGIAAEHLATIFEPFRQVGENRHKIQGTGLGLSIARKLAGLMNGTLTVESTLGSGSIFRFALPMPPVSPADSAESPPATAPLVTGYRRLDGRTEPYRILVVDNLVEDRAVLAKLLRPLGFAIREAEDGEQCLASLQREKPDLILMDLKMPNLDGLEATRRLRNLPAFQHLPVVAVTAGVFMEDRQQSEAAGCQAFVAKPVRRPVLLAVLEKLLGLSWQSINPTTPADSEEKLPREQAERLYQLVKSGDIVRIIELAGSLKQATTCPRLAETISSLANECNLRPLRQLLERQLAGKENR